MMSRLIAAVLLIFGLVVVAQMNDPERSRALLHGPGPPVRHGPERDELLPGTGQVNVDRAAPGRGPFHPGRGPRGVRK